VLVLWTQFLALESPEAVPRNIGKLARKHKGVTLLFMDIVGFTEFSKVHEGKQLLIPKQKTSKWGEWSN